MSTTSLHRIFIIENQVLLGKAIGMILNVSPVLEIAGDAPRLDERILRDAAPDVVLIDVDARDVNIESAAALIASVDPKIRICALSEQLSRVTMERCRNAGMLGYIVKDVAVEEFRRAIGVVGSGMRYTDKRLLERSSYHIYGEESSHLLDLSTREGEVVRYIVAGLANKEIASKLSLSEKTIKNHVSRIFSKFDCTARTQVAVQAIRAGLA